MKALIRWLKRTFLVSWVEALEPGTYLVVVQRATMPLSALEALQAACKKRGIDMVFLRVSDVDTVRVIRMEPCEKPR